MINQDAIVLSNIHFILYLKLKWVMTTMKCINSEFSVIQHIEIWNGQLLLIGPRVDKRPQKNQCTY